MSLLEAPYLIEAPPQVSAHCYGIIAPHKIEAPGASNTKFTESIHKCTAKQGTCCSKSQWWPPKTVSLLLACLNCHMSKHTISTLVMPKMARSRSVLHNVLAQGASIRDIMVSALNEEYYTDPTEIKYDTISCTALLSLY